MMETLIYGTTEIIYSITYSNRKTLGISVNPDGQVIVIAPVDISKEKIEEKINKRAPWILKQQHFFNSFGEKMPLRRYINGESHLYMGKQYILRIVKGKHNSVSFKGHSFEVEMRHATSLQNAESVQRLMKEWYKERAKIKFAEIAEPIIQRFKKYNVEPTSLYIQNMENRWGSCTPNGKIILNTELIKALKPCIEYVITHELCHLVHQRHTHAFYDLLTVEMPDWERWKNKLEQLMH
ncbi:hypothetical protein EZS27_034352 [termite gut metagenome]|uniref:YgjP-like metallopeptidase domain-containing protein n=1 Tax=termite gut metagenome TaxID=433724 RepID=A0A5J4Q0B8_9ZZZZ